MKQKITTKDLLEKIQNSKKIFTITFIKKDGSKRVMNARLDVKKHLHGGTLPYNPKEKALLPVFDMQANAYRMVNTKTITHAKLDNEEFEVCE
jgi:hypothetical protein